MGISKDLTSTKVGKLTLLKRKRENGRTYYYCRCECGNEKWIRADSLTSGKIISCGCYNKENNYKKSKDIKGNRYGRLTAIEPIGKKDKYNGSIIWKCKCDCGNIVFVSESTLKKGTVRSCGCLRKENSRSYGKIIGKLTKENCIEGTNIRNLTMRVPKRNKSGVKGVYWDKTRNKWTAQIRFKGKNYFLGRYVDKKEAINARQKAESEIFGNFLNWYNKEYKKG